MIEPRDLPALSREELLALVVELRRQITELSANDEALRAEIDQLEHGGKRQAALFSKSTRVADPKPPGRTPGSGTFRNGATGMRITPTALPTWTPALIPSASTRSL
jgi:transposase